MSNRIPSTPRHQSQSETDTETSSRVSSPSSSEQSSASEDGPEKSAQAPVMKTRPTRDTAQEMPPTQSTNSSAPSQAAMTSSSPSVKNRQDGEQKRADYAKNLPAYRRHAQINKMKTVKQGGAVDIEQAPKPDNRWDQFTKAVTADGKLTMRSFDENEMSEFVAWLRTSPSSLRELYFDNSGMSRAHAIALAEVLRGNTTLIKLEVTGYLGEEGAAAIADALKVNATLAELKISCDFIGDEGTKALADALKINKTLTKLDLFAYEITDEGEKAMLEALRVNEALTSLRFSPTLIGQFDAETSNLLERNRCLKL